ncbi:MAG: superoxide dismutase family protein [Pseudomonadota bacterium]|nr:superoxide dismutase family protein [Pseudomonadota bacterium]
MKKFYCGLIAVGSLLSVQCFALNVRMELTDKAKTPIGTIAINQTPYGVLLIPDLKSLPPGPHGFHMHMNPTCAEQGMAAGGHFDTGKTEKHLGPYGNGHLGELPVLWVGSDGSASTPVLAPRLKISDFPGHSLMIHAGGDNYSDTPEKLGGGGARIACGVVPQ